MATPPLAVADIFRQSGHAYRDTHGASRSPQPHRAMRAIERWRTAALGGHVDQCDHCGHHAISSHACRHRQCPKGPSLATAQWLEERS